MTQLASTDPNVANTITGNPKPLPDRLESCLVTLADNALLRLPLVRFGNAFTAGPAEATWKAWLAAAKG